MTQAHAVDSELLGQTEVMQKVWHLIQRAAESTATVLIRGESGTGKELVARAIHKQSARTSGNFVTIDCTMLTDTLAQSDLFGHTKGAFTGAHCAKSGMLRAADGGTAFLDEIGEATLVVQARLLRLLQDGSFFRVGSVEVERVDARFVLATNRDLESMVRQGQFREDLYYRMRTVELWLPPLRARRDDIVRLAKHFCEKYVKFHKKRRVTLAPDTLEFLRCQRWPGNVRELEKYVEQLVVVCDSEVIGIQDVIEATKKPEFKTESVHIAAGPAGCVGNAGTTQLPVAEDQHAIDDELPLDADAVEPRSPSDVCASLPASIAEEKRRMAHDAMREAGGDAELAARKLGIARSTLYKYLALKGRIATK